MKGNYTAKHNHHQAATHRDRKNDYNRNDYTNVHDLEQDDEHDTTEEKVQTSPKGSQPL